MEDVKVSIVVPNYNHFQFLQQRLDSIFAQTYQNFEVILLDDCSTDNSIEILNRYTNHPQVSHVIINETNSGSTFKQWKTGISFAKGTYIWIAESDDWADVNFLELLVPTLENNPNIGLAYCQSYRANEKSEVLYSNIEWTNDLDKNRWSSDYINNGLNEIANYLSFKNTIPNASGVIFRKDCIESAEFPISMKMKGDWYLWVSILKKSDIFYNHQCLNYFRDTSASTRVVNTREKELTRLKERAIVYSYIYLTLNRNNETALKNFKHNLKEFVFNSKTTIYLKSTFFLGYCFKHFPLFSVNLIIIKAGNSFKNRLRYILKKIKN